MKKSICVWLMTLPVIALSGQVPLDRQAVPVWTDEEIDNALSKLSLRIRISAFNILYISILGDR